MLVYWLLHREGRTVNSGAGPGVSFEKYFVTCFPVSFIQPAEQLLMFQMQVTDQFSTASSYNSPNHPCISPVGVNP